MPSAERWAMRASIISAGNSNNCTESHPTNTEVCKERLRKERQNENIIRQIERASPAEICLMFFLMESFYESDFEQRFVIFGISEGGKFQ